VGAAVSVYSVCRQDVTAIVAKFLTRKHVAGFVQAATEDISDDSAVYFRPGKSLAHGGSLGWAGHPDPAEAFKGFAPGENLWTSAAKHALLGRVGRLACPLADAPRARPALGRASANFGAASQRAQNHADSERRAACRYRLVARHGGRRARRPPTRRGQSHSAWWHALLVQHSASSTWECCCEAPSCGDCCRPRRRPRTRHTSLALEKQLTFLSRLDDPIRA
jgi:hypothetical protein